MLVMSGIGFRYFSLPIVVFNVGINLKLLYGCGIGVALGLFIGMWIFLFFTKFPCNFAVTLPLYLLMCILYMVFSLPSRTDKTLEYWAQHIGEKPDAFQDIQYQYKCCGWKHYNDTGLPVCPYDFTSGCESVVKDYFQPRYKELFISSILMMIVFTVSFVVIIVYVCIEDSDAVISDVLLLENII